MSAVILRADARSLPLPDASVDLIVTSPPYFGLRSYTDGGEHYDGQIGSEATTAEFLAALWQCTAEWVRVLKPAGSIFVNLGDKYASGGRRTYDRDDKGISGKAGDGQRGGAVRPRDGFADKTLLGLPWRYALGCIDQLGLILRAEIVWAKPNGLPESVTDRVRRAHEQVFHFTRQPRYYAAVDEVREPHAYPADIARARSGYIGKDVPGKTAAGNVSGGNPLGKLPGSVWEIPSAPLVVPAHLEVDHFAAFPPALVRPLVLGWSPSGICTACDEGRRPVSGQAQRVPNERLSLSTRARTSSARGSHIGSTLGYPAQTADRRIIGYACACPTPDAPTRPAVVLDPFGGTGTTALVATVHGRHGISVDRSADYCRLAAWRTTDPGERARALGVPKPPPVPDGMDALFGIGEIA